MPRFVGKKMDVINLNQLHINDVGFPTPNFIENKKRKHDTQTNSHLPTFSSGT